MFACIDLDWASFEKVMAAKVDGATHLHNLTKGMDLDFFVLFSSATSAIGNVGQVRHHQHIFRESVPDVSSRS